VFLYFCQSNDKDLNPTIAIELAKELQSLCLANGDVKGRDLMQQNGVRRKTIHSIVASHKLLQEKPALQSLEAAFEQQLAKESGEDGKDMIHCMAL
jgi:hypothetical protein